MLLSFSVFEAAGRSRIKNLKETRGKTRASGRKIGWGRDFQDRQASILLIQLSGSLDSVERTAIGSPALKIESALRETYRD